MNITYEQHFGVDYGNGEEVTRYHYVDKFGTGFAFYNAKGQLIRVEREIKQHGEAKWAPLKWEV